MGGTVCCATANWCSRVTVWCPSNTIPRRRGGMARLGTAPGFVDLDALGDLDGTILGSDNQPAWHKDRVWPRSHVERGRGGGGLRPENYRAHSLRQTKASIIYKQTGNLRGVQIVLGHAKIATWASTSRVRSRSLTARRCNIS
jgi:integrase